MNPIFSFIFNVLPEHLRKNAVISGGAAVDISRAADIDLFVIDVKDPIKFGRELATIPNVKLHKPATIQPANQKQSPRKISHLNAIDSYAASGNCVAGTIPNGILPTVQIIASEWPTVQELLKHFNLSVHCIAYSPDGTKHTIPETTEPNVPIKTVHVHTPEMTLLRYRKLCLRYNVPPDATDIAALCTSQFPRYVVGIDMGCDLQGP